MKLKDIPELLEYLPDDVDPEADVNDRVVPSTIPGEWTTALCWAIEMQLTGPVKLLLEHCAKTDQDPKKGVDPNAPGAFKHTPLLLAVDKPKMMTLLLQAGVKLELRGNFNKTVIDTLLSRSQSFDMVNFAPDGPGYPFRVLSQAIYKQVYAPLSTEVTEMISSSSGLSKDPSELIHQYSKSRMAEISPVLITLPKYMQKMFEEHCRRANEMVLEEEAFKKYASEYAAQARAPASSLSPQSQHSPLTPAYKATAEHQSKTGAEHKPPILPVSQQTDISKKSTP